MEEIWESRCINLDETQDAWLTMAYQEEEYLLFTWQGWREPCPVEDIGRVFTTRTKSESVIQAIDDCLTYLESKY